MAEPEQTVRAKRSRRPTARSGKPEGTAIHRAASQPALSAEQRHALIAENAYQRAAKRGFSGGDPVADWLQSEREVDALLARHAD